METKFNFKSAVCTSRSQSEHLLALGLKKETADCYWVNHLDIWIPIADRPLDDNDIPAWSLGRLFALANGVDWRAEITLKDERYGIHYEFASYWYDDIFEAVIAWIENDIKEGYFNKEYLV